jgi:nitrite reductase/ring-hydroxylating ferredoxin subunit
MTEHARPSSWWAVARSEEVSAKKPLSVDIGTQPVVLWRDSTGVVRALEDRCPHRRAPLSLGCILKSGLIQCGYHGWIYDGETGRLREIPNMKDKQRFPPLYKATAFSVLEAGGFVRISLDAAAPAPGLPDATLPLSGTTHVALDHAQYVAAMFDDPSLIMAIRGVHFTPYLMAELHLENDRFRMERSCQWKATHWPSPFSAEFPLTMVTLTDPWTGETQLTLRDDAFNILLEAALAPTPAARGGTAIRWRAQLGPARKSMRARMLGIGAPITLFDAVDAAALRVLKPTASRHGEDLRADLSRNTQAAIAA